MAWEKIEQAPDEDKRDENDSTKWELKEGGTLIGEYVAKKTGVGQYKSNLYQIRDGEGKLWHVFGCSSLDDKFTNAVIGDEVKLEYHGKKMNQEGTQSYHNYDLWISR